MTLVNAHILFIGLLLLVHGDGVCVWRRNVLTFEKNRKIQVHVKRGGRVGKEGRRGGGGKK